MVFVSENDAGSVFSEQEVFSDDDFEHEIFSDDDFGGGSASLEDSELHNLLDRLQVTESSSVADVGQTQVVLEEGVWDALPEELLDKILTWLPPATLFRFRCVCTRWETLFFSPGWLQNYAQVKCRPSCSVMCTLGAREADFFCHTERRWLKIPLNPVSYLELDWELADSDAGLFCYQCNWSGGLWLCVCNPLTQSSKVLPPNYPHWDVQPSNCELVKLLVDRESKTFKVVVLVHSSNPPTTVVYDSTTSLWTVCRSFPPQDFRHGTFFVWKNAVYSQCFQPNLLLAFGIDSGMWAEVASDLPCHLTRRHFIVNSRHTLLLIQLDLTVEEQISAWKLVEDAPRSSSSSSKSKWVKLTLSTPPKRLLSDVHSCFTQSDSICFSTSHTNKWITYTFATKSWEKMPSRGRRMASYSWFEWEPRLDIDVESDPLYESG